MLLRDGLALVMLGALGRHALWERQLTKEAVVAARGSLRMVVVAMVALRI